MIKLIVFVVRKPGLSFAEFDTYWRETHGPLVKATTEFSRHIRKYVQAHRAADAVPLAMEADYDGVAELYYDSVESLDAAFNEPRYMEVIRPDELKFIDLERCVSIVCEEHAVI